MSDGGNYWENEAISPEKFLSDPVAYLKKRGYVASHLNEYDGSGMICVKQFGVDQVRVIFSNKRFQVVGLKSGVRFVNVEGPAELVEKELSELELKLKPVRQ